MIEKNKSNNYIEELSCEEYCEDNGICDTISGTPVSYFNFAAAETIPATTLFNSAIETSEISVNYTLPDNRKLKTIASEITTPINGEPLNLPRTYKIRISTAKMLNEIKAVNPDVNIYMNTIVDTALRHYYNYIFNKTL